MWPDACAMASRWAPGVAEPSGPVMALPPKAITTRRVTPATLVRFLLAVKYLLSAQLDRRTVVADRALHPADVVPVAVLPTDPPLDADRLEAHRPVQSLARRVGQGHARDQPSVAAPGQPLEQGLVQRAAGSAAAPSQLQVDADLARPAVGGPVFHRRGVGVADDTVVLLEHHPGVAFVRDGDAAGHVLRGRRLVLERDDRFGDVRPVDRRAGRAVLSRGVPDGRHRRQKSNWSRPGRKPAASTTSTARSNFCPTAFGAWASLPKLTASPPSSWNHRTWSAEASGLVVFTSSARPVCASARKTARYSSS